MSEGRKDKDTFIAAMYGLDPDKLRQLRRITSGMTRCPECDAVNVPTERFCAKCGTRLYPAEEADEALLARRSRKSGERDD